MEEIDADKQSLVASIARRIAKEPGRLPSGRAIAERFDVPAEIARDARALAADFRYEDRLASGGDVPSLPRKKLVITDETRRKVDEWFASRQTNRSM